MSEKPRRPQLVKKVEDDSIRLLIPVRDKDDDEPDYVESKPLTTDGIEQLNDQINDYLSSKI